MNKFQVHLDTLTSEVSTAQVRLLRVRALTHSHLACRSPEPFLHVLAFRWA